MATISSIERYGNELLRKVEGTQETLEDFFKDLRRQIGSEESRTGIAELDELWRSHPEHKRLTLKGRGIVLLYEIIDALLSEGGTVAVVDLSGHFSPSQLRSSKQELDHVHVFQATPQNFQVTMQSIKPYMETGEHKSKHRVWKSTMVVGGVGGDISVNWNGWLHVEREDVVPFPPGISVEEALRGREQRADAVESKLWKAVAERGEGRFTWGGRDAQEY